MTNPEIISHILKYVDDTKLLSQVKNINDIETSGRGRLLGPATKSKMATMCVVCSV